MGRAPLPEAPCEHVPPGNSELKGYSSIEGPSQPFPMAPTPSEQAGDGGTLGQGRVFQCAQSSYSKCGCSDLSIFFLHIGPEHIFSLNRRHTFQTPPQACS